MLIKREVNEKSCIKFKEFIKINKEDKDYRKDDERKRVKGIKIKRVRLNRCVRLRITLELIFYNDRRFFIYVSLINLSLNSYKTYTTR